MKLRAILLFLMIALEFLLHLNLLDKINIPYVSQMIPQVMSPVWFWLIYLGIELFLMLTLLGGGTTIKNKTEVKIDMGKIKQDVADEIRKEIKENLKEREKDKK